MLARLSVADEAHSEAPLMVVLTNISSALLCDLRQHLTTVKRGASHATLGMHMCGLEALFIDVDDEETLTCANECSRTA